MRISTLQFFNSGVGDMTSLNSQVVKTQSQVSSGIRVQTPGDDPLAAARILQLEEEQALRKQYMTNISDAKGRLEYEDGVLKSITESIKRVNELTIQAGNGSYNLDNRSSLAIELNLLQKQLADLMNTKSASGEYLFSGFQGSIKPFIQQPGGGYTYQGDEGQRFIQIASSTQVALSNSGKKAFVNIPSAEKTFITSSSPLNTSNPPAGISQGLVIDQEAYDKFYPEDLIITFNAPSAIVPAQSNYTITQKSDGRVLAANEPFAMGDAISSNGISVNITGEPAQGDTFFVDSSSSQDLLTTVGRLAESLKTIPDSNPAGLKKMLDTTLTNLKSAQTSISEVRSSLGARLNTMESTHTMLSQMDVDSKKIISTLKNVDLAEAASQLAFEKTVLEAAQASYVQVSRLSLFNFL